MKNSTKKSDIMRNTSKKQYKNMNSKSSFEYSKSYNASSNLQDMKEKYNESFNKVSHENLKSSNNNSKNYSYNKSKRMDEIKKRKSYYNMDSNKSLNVEKMSIQKATSNNNLNSHSNGININSNY